MVKSPIAILTWPNPPESAFGSGARSGLVAVNDVVSRKAPAPASADDGQKIQPRFERLDNLTAIRLDQRLAGRPGERQSRDQAATAADFGRQLTVAHAAGHRERVRPVLVRAGRSRSFRAQAGVDLRQVGHARGRSGIDRRAVPSPTPRWTPLLSYRPASRHRRVRHDPQPEVNSCPAASPAGSVTLKPAGDEKARPVADGDQLRARERRQHLSTNCRRGCSRPAAPGPGSCRGRRRPGSRR